MGSKKPNVAARGAFRIGLALMLVASMVPSLAWAEGSTAAEPSEYPASLAPNEEKRSDSDGISSLEPDVDMDGGAASRPSDTSGEAGVEDGEAASPVEGTPQPDAGNANDDPADDIAKNESGESAKSSDANAGALLEQEDSSAMPLADDSVVEATVEPQAAPAPLSASLAKDEKTVTVKLDKSVAPTATSVLLPTWSVAGGQDDIIWYAATKNADGSWQASIPISRHRTAGGYTTHAYVTTGGVQKFVGEVGFTVVAPAAAINAKPQTADQKKVGAFTLDITVSNVPSGVARVQVPVWSTAGGQDDIEWLEARSLGGGKWTVDVSLAHPRRAAGDYIAHVYVTTGNGVFAFAGQITTKVTIEGATLTATVSADQKSVTIRGMGGDLARATSVMIPTWSLDGGQDDIRWYLAQKKGGVWELTVPIINHRSAGEYAAHAYAVVGGRQRFVGATSFSVKAPKMTVALSQSDAQKKTGTFTVTAQVVSGSGAAAPTRVQVPVWSLAGGQDDIQWLDATNRGGGTWTAEVSLAHPRRAVGEYAAHAYATCENGVFAYAGEGRGTVSVSKEEISVSLSADQKTATVKAVGGVFALATSVAAPTWSTSGGQDDIIWYGARKSNGAWVATIPISNHRDAGKYAVHLYATVGGSSRFGGAGEFSVTPLSGGSVSVSKNDAAGTVTVTVSGISSKSGVARVLVPTWTTAGGQDDIVWHEAQNLGNGTFRATIAANQHNCEAGTYVSHVYAVGGNGVQNYIGQGQASLSLRNYVHVTGGNGTRTVWIRNPSSSTSGVQVPTWSAASKQGDLVWYSARHVGGGLWRADIDCSRFSNAGTCHSHVYSGSTLLAMTTFNVSESEIATPVQRAMNSRVNGLASSTGWLLAVDTNNCTVGVYRGSKGSWTARNYWACSPGANATPTVKGIFRVQSRGYSFGSGYTCYYWTQFQGNYLFHSVLYNQGTRVIQDGRLGQKLSHGCVRLHIDNAKWIYDNIPSGTTVLIY